MDGTRHILNSRFGRVAALLLLAGMLLRGVVPQNFMPDWQAAAAGVITLTLCSVDGAGQVVTLDADGNAVPGDTGDDGKGYGICGFTLLSAVVPLLLALVLLVIMVWRRRQALPPNRIWPPGSDVTLAHGARAPPAFA